MLDGGQSHQGQPGHQKCDTPPQPHPSAEPQPGTLLLPPASQTGRSLLHDPRIQQGYFSLVEVPGDSDLGPEPFLESKSNVKGVKQEWP